MNNLKYTIKDTITMTQRVLKHTTKSIDTLITVVLMPVMIFLMSVYIYGSAMNMTKAVYVEYVVPGILVLTIFTASAYTAYRITQDITKGIFERFHSMPIAKSSIVAGHVYTSVVYNFISLIFVFAISMFFGYRVEVTFVSVVMGFVLILVLNLAITWVGVFFGLISKNIESSGIFAYILMGLVFVSSAFAPVETMSSGLKAFATHQPFTYLIDGLRTLFSTGSTSNDLWIGLVVSLGILAVFRLGSMIVYKKRFA